MPEPLVIDKIKGDVIGQLKSKINELNLQLKHNQYSIDEYEESI